MPLDAVGVARRVETEFFFDEKGRLQGPTGKPPREYNVAVGLELTGGAFWIVDEDSSFIGIFREGEDIEEVFAGLRGVSSQLRSESEGT